MEIRHPEWLQVKYGQETGYGYSQSWYSTRRKRASGCGPTAATMLLLYLNRREMGSLPYTDNTIPAITEALEAIWDFVTPGWLGLSSTKKFCRGVAAFLRHHHLAWSCHRFSVPVCMSRRRSLAQTVDFLEQGLAADCPIAFLNLDKGQEKCLETWHWIIVTALVYEEQAKRYIVTCYDGGRRLSFDLNAWLTTSKLGGGFAFVTTGNEK